MTPETVPPETRLNHRSNKKLWLAAIKPPMYSVAIMPIWVGSMVAFAETSVFQVHPFFIFLASAILILAWENLSNDVFDADTGVDVNKAHSLVNLTGNKPMIFWIGNFCLLVGLLGICALSFMQQDGTVIGLILLSCFLGYTYQGPPFRLGYYGVGEVICFICFGPLAFAAAYYSQTKAWSSVNMAASLIVGITTSLILFCSHFHQVKDDAAVGKRSPIVRLGTARSARLLTWFCAAIYGLTGLFVIGGVFPITTLLLFLSFPVALKLIRHVGKNHNRPLQVSNCKFIAVSLHFWSGLLLGVGFLLAGVW
jgi:1,4-dihydroxy-2-naphthoate octaprenyltransferase